MKLDRAHESSRRAADESQKGQEVGGKVQTSNIVPHLQVRVALPQAEL